MTQKRAMTTTQFVAQALALLPYVPRPPGWGASNRCWLCGGSTGGVGWPQRLAIAPTFTQHNTAACADSDAVCQSCAAVTRAESFQALVARRGLPLKVWTQCGWHSYSHYVREDGGYEAPTPSRMRAILLEPPDGRWLLTLNTTGQKHTIFRARVATTPAWFPVQLDEETLWTSAADLRECLAAFEALAAIGCGKDGIQTGRYHPADTMRAGVALWRPAEAAMAPWRDANPLLVALVRVIAHSAKTIAAAREDSAQ